MVDGRTNTLAPPTPARPARSPARFRRRVAVVADVRASLADRRRDSRPRSGGAAGLEREQRTTRRHPPGSRVGLNVDERTSRTSTRGSGSAQRPDPLPSGSVAAGGRGRRPHHARVVAGAALHLLLGRLEAPPDRRPLEGEARVGREGLAGGSSRTGPSRGAPRRRRRSHAFLYASRSRSRWTHARARSRWALRRGGPA